MPKLQTHAQLRELQRLTGTAIMRPLGTGDRTQRNWLDGRTTAAVLEEIIKPNDRLTSVERIEIYNRQYWFRLIDILWEDYPGLRAVMGDNKFSRFTRAYLERHPSRSFTLRNLGSAIGQFLEDEPKWASPRPKLAADMARFEWAQVEAFDGAECRPLGVDDLLGADPVKLKLGIQPHITILEMDYPLDDFLLAIKKGSDALRSEASNAVEQDEHPSGPSKRVRLPRRKITRLAVHRYDNSIYYKPLEPAAYGILRGLRAGLTLAAAVEQAMESVPARGRPAAAKIQGWFETWTAMGWFCKWNPANRN